MKEILVIWAKGDDPTAPPAVCPDTFKTVKEVVDETRLSSGGEDVIFRFEEDISPGHGGSILTIDGIALEELVPLPDPSKYCGFSCDDCSSGGVSGRKECPKAYEQVPESVLRLALAKASERIVTG